MRKMATPVKMLLTGLALAVCLPAPALADETNRADEVARRLEDPMTQYMVAGALAAVTKQMLDMRLDPFVRAVESAGGRDALPDVPPDATLGDFAGPEARQLPKKIMRHVPALMDSLAGLANAYGDMVPEFEAAAKRVKDAAPSR